MMMQALDVVYRHELPDQIKQMRAQMEQMRLDAERARMSAEDSWSGNMKIVEIMNEHIKVHLWGAGEMTPLWWEARDAMRRISRVINPPPAW